MSAYISVNLYIYTHIERESKQGKILKTGKSEKGFFTMFSINLKLFQNKNLNTFLKNIFYK